ncbi:hypothetical protein M422DRAFT_205310 [Sphaerobolus stellatus SS14]|nr:hypothetical protein M422DRAFT_205310 [Sphaerobolus stellatus SS14]
MLNLMGLIERANLTQFCWNHAFEGTVSLPILIPKLFQSSPRLRELQISSYGSRHSLAPSHPLILNHKEISMQALRSINLHLNFPYTHYTSTVSGLIDFLIYSCPSIVDLRLSLIISEVISMPQFLQQGRWSKMKRLSLYGHGFYDVVTEPEQASVLRKFLSRHPTLQCLWIGGEGLLSPDCIPEDLPNLRSWRRSGNTIPYTAIFKEKTARNIQHLSGYTGFACLPAIMQMTSLKTCVIDLFEDNDCIPVLESLPISVERIDFAPRESGFFGAEAWLERLDLWKPSLIRLKNLTHIGSLFRRADIGTKAGRSLLRELGSLPRLLYVQITYGSAPTWILMHRGQNGEYIRHKHLLQGTGVNPRLWGGQFDGIGLKDRHMKILP